MPRVSVIIPVYNVEAYLRQCLDSVVNQTLRDIEAICVDDGSTDGSAAILAEYAAKDARVRVIRQENRGAGAARNAGLSAATGAHLFFFDPDDYAAPEMLERLAARADATGADVVVAGRRTVDSATGKAMETLLPPRRLSELPQPFAPASAQSLFQDAGVQPWTKLFRASFVRGAEIRFQEIQRANDLRFVCTALAAAGSVAVEPAAYYVFRRGRPGSLQTTGAGGVAVFADALASLRDELERRGLAEAFARPYRNLALAHSIYNLFGHPDAAAFGALYAELHGGIFDRLGLSGLPDGAFDNAQHCRYMRLIVGSPDPSGLFMQLLRERHLSWVASERAKARIAALERKVASLEREIRKSAAAAREVAAQ